MPYLAGLTGNQLKYSNLANDLELNEKLVKSHVEVLELVAQLCQTWQGCRECGGWDAPVAPECRAKEASSRWHECC